MRGREEAPEDKRWGELGRGSERPEAALQLCEDERKGMER